jgi:hypothetical protein
MKARLVPIYFKTADTPDFATQLQKLHELLADEADILEPVLLGESLPETDAVIFPEMLGIAFREVEKIKKLPQPILVVTSEFGTVSMWDCQRNESDRSHQPSKDQASLPDSGVKTSVEAVEDARIPG